MRRDPAEWETARGAFADALPAPHRDLLRHLITHAVIGDYIFVHAGVRPGVAISEQTEKDLLWIRRSFLQAARACDLTVVHGHSAEMEPQIAAGRVGVDTAAYATGVLTAARLQGEDLTFIRVSDNTALATSSLAEPPRASPQSRQASGGDHVQRHIPGGGEGDDGTAAADATPRDALHELVRVAALRALGFTDTDNVPPAVLAFLADQIDIKAVFRVHTT